MRLTRRKDSLSELRLQLYAHIKKNYPSTESFCKRNRLNSATISNFLLGKKDFQVSTLDKIAKAINKTLQIKFR